jgi:muramoyltetrapeptide carboxypeptidase
MLTIPPFLQPGDTIAITCPAGFMPRDKAQTCIDTLQTWGYRVVIGDTLGGTSSNYFAGTDRERLADLQRFLDDPQVDAILFGRGGYGLSRIIDDIDFAPFAAKPKWLIGFSDITVLHSHVFSNYHIAALHAPMAGAFNEGGASSPSAGYAPGAGYGPGVGPTPGAGSSPGIGSLRHALAGGAADYTCRPAGFNRNGQATGPLVGGNLTLLAHLVGSRSDIDTTDKLLFLEDVGEYRYNVDRMLRQLRRCGKLAGLAGLLIGGFTDMKDTTRPFGATVEEIIRDVVDDYDYPICFDFPVSHGRENVALKIGVTHTLKVSNEGARLIET